MGVRDLSDWHGEDGRDGEDNSIVVDGRRFRVGQVIERSFSTTARNFIPFFAISFGLTLLAYILIFVLAFFGLAGIKFDEEYFELSARLFITFLVVSVSIFGIFTLLFSTIVYATVQDLTGGRPAIGACVVHAWGRLLPVIGVTILLILMLGIGFIFLIIPGIILFGIFGLASSAAVVEPSGVVDSFRTSAALTKGNRWRVLGVFVLVFVIELVIGLIAGALSLAISLTFGSAVIELLTTIAQILLQAFFFVFNTVVFGVVYHDLRIARERAVP